MLKRLLALCALLAGASQLLGADAPNVVALNLTASTEHPRNSEGAFITLRSGRILFCYSQFSGGTSDFSPCRIAVVSSDDQGRTWSEPRVLFTPEPHTIEMSTSILRLASGNLLFFSLIKHGTLDCRPYLRVSTDDGASWSAPRSLLAAPGYFVLNNDRVIETAKGRLIMPLAFHRSRRTVDDGTDSVDPRAIDLWYTSDDEGTTWTESKTWWSLPAATETGLQEPGVVELADGSIYSWSRTDQGCQYACRSSDHGETWSAPQPTTLRSPCSPASIKRVPGTPDLLAVFNDHSGQVPFVTSAGTYSGRNPQTLSTSPDGGVTWIPRKVIENDPERDYCYIAIHFAGDSVLLAYMSNSRNPAKPFLLTIRRLGLSWLLAPETPDATRARAALHEIFGQEESWIKIHAAEALIAGGEAIQLRDKFLRLAPAADTLPYRVGVWRVLANTSPTAPERAACVAQVEKIFLNLSNPDRSQAIETLDKLRVKVSGPMLDLVQKTARDGPEKLKPLALWSLRLAGEPGAVEGLAALLRSPEVSQRLNGAYALRLLHETDPLLLRTLATAADAEKPDTTAYPYLVSAAFALNADPARHSAWRKILEGILTTGAMEARFEACHGLRAEVSLPDLPRYTALLDDPGKDTRVGAAFTILQVHARE